MATIRNIITPDGTTYSIDSGKGISTISKTGTSGLVDTYTITLTDGTTSTFTVTNGEKGEKGGASYSFMVDSDGYICLHYKEDTKA